MEKFDLNIFKDSSSYKLKWQQNNILSSIL